MEMFDRKETDIEGKIEFDVLVDGKYKERISRGVLVADDFDGSGTYIAGNGITVFKASHSLEETVDRRDIRDQYEKFKKFMNDGPKDLSEIMNKLFDIILDKGNGSEEE